MIYIDKNIENLVALTLLENSKYTSNRFLFKFENDYNKMITYINKESIVNNIRYTGFRFRDGDISNPDFNLKSGQYTYTVYLMPLNSTSINIDDALQVLETGRMYVIGESIGLNPVYQ